MSRAVGIDLGTTNSVVAQMRKSDARIVDNQDNKDLTPSVVHITEDGESLVGALAKSMGGKSPENTVFSIKRFMGRDFKDPVCKDDIRRVPYEVVEAQNGEVEVVLRGQRYSPPEISAFILEALKRDAQAALDEEVAHAVITVPAYFGNRQKDTTRRAGQLAGLEVMSIIPEPTAAALAYGFEADMEQPKTILVYDLGGGTFDVTVMYIAAGLFEDQGKTGDMHLGGDDFDHKIMDWLVEQVRIQHQVNLRELPNAAEALWILKQNAEEAKIRLGRQNRVPIVVPGLVRVNGKLVDVECELSRDEFNRMIKPDVDRSIDLLYEAIKLAKTTSDDIDSILMVGGSTRVLLVEESLRNIFGDRVIRGNVNPMHCVAQGAAIQTLLVKPNDIQAPSVDVECGQCGARNLPDRPDCRSCGKLLSGSAGPVPKRSKPAPTIECMDCHAPNPYGQELCNSCGKRLDGGIVPIQTTPFPIGVQLVGDVFEAIIEQNTPYPMEKPVSKVLKTSSPGQELIRLPIYEGLKDVASENQYLGVVTGDLPPGLPEKTNVAVSLSLDGSGILEVNATLPDKKEVEIKASIHWKEVEKESIRGGGGGGGDDEGGGGGDRDRGGGGSGGWSEEAQFLLFQASAVKEEGEAFIPSNVLNPLMQMAAQLLMAIQVNDEKNGRALMAQLETALASFGLFVEVGYMRAISQNPDIARKVGFERMDRLASGLAKIDYCKQQRNVAGLRQVLEELASVFNEIMDVIQNLPDRGLLSGLLSGSTTSKKKK